MIISAYAIDEILRWMNVLIYQVAYGRQLKTMAK